MDIYIKKLLNENKFILSETKIDNSSLGSLVEEAKLSAIKKAQWAFIARQLELTHKNLSSRKDQLTARLIDRITKDAEEKGKPIASSAVKDLVKVRLPLFKQYQKLDKMVKDAEVDSRFAMRMFRIMESRGRTIEILMKIEGDLSQKEKLAFSDSEVMMNRHKIMKGRLIKILKKYGEQENEI